MEKENIRPDLTRVSSFMDWEGEVPDSEAELKDWLSQRIGQMLQNQSERLMQAFYRLDISEPKVKAVFSSCAPELWPDLLAGLVLEREKERAYWRAKYQ